MSLSNSVAVEGREPLRTYSAQGYQSLIDKFKSPQLGGTVGFGAQFDSLLPLPTGIEFRYSPNFQSAYDQYVWNIKNTSFEFLLTITIYVLFLIGMSTLRPNVYKTAINIKLPPNIDTYGDIPKAVGISPTNIPTIATKIA